MSIRAMNAVWEHSQHEDTKLNLMLALADSANDDGDCWPSVLGLSHKIRRKPRQTRNLLRALEESGEITTRIEAGPEGKNIYHINLPGATLENAKGKPKAASKLPPGNSYCRPPATAIAAKSSVIVVNSSSELEEDSETITTDGLAATAIAAPRQQSLPPPTSAATPSVQPFLDAWRDCGVEGEYLHALALGISQRPDGAEESDDILDYWEAWNQYAAADRRLGPGWIVAQLKALAACSPSSPREFRWMHHAPPKAAKPEYWRRYTAEADPWSAQAQTSDPHSLLSQLLNGPVEEREEAAA